MNGDDWMEIVLVHLVLLCLHRAAKEWMQRNKSLTLNHPVVKYQTKAGKSRSRNISSLSIASSPILVDLVEHCILEGRINYESRQDEDKTGYHKLCPLGLVIAFGLLSKDNCHLV